MAPSGWWQRLSLACHFLCCFARGLGCATLLCLWLCAHLLLGLGFPMLPGYPSPSIRLWVYWFQWLLFSTRVPYLRDGVTPAGSRFFCPRSKRRLSVPVWVRYTSQFMVGPRTSVCGVSAHPVPQGVLPRGPRGVRDLRLSLAPSSVLPCPMLGFRVASTTLAAGLGLSWVPCPTSAGWGFVPRSVARLAPFYWVVLTELGGSWFSPLCSPGRRSASRPTCSALPPVSRLFFGLVAFSFGWGFGLCLTILLAPCGCRCACCDPPCGCKSARVLPSLLGPSPSWVCHLSRICSLSWRPCRSRSLIPSLAPSWWWPCPLLRWALLTLSGYVLSVPSAVSLRRSRWSIPSHCRPSCTVSLLTVSVIGARFAYAVGRLPMRLVP